MPNRPVLLPILAGRFSFTLIVATININININMIIHILINMILDNYTLP